LRANLAGALSGQKRLLLAFFSSPQTQLRFQTEMRARQTEAAPVELTNRLPFKRVQFGVIDIVGLIHERYGRCRISSSVRRLMSMGPAPPQVVAPWEISSERAFSDYS